MSDPRPVPFSSWVAIPRRIFNDVASGIVTPTEGRVEMCLYERANPRTWIANFLDLDALARRLAWDLSASYLSKTLRSLRSKGRIAFKTTPGKTKQSYAIRLLYARPDESEHGPSRIDEAGPSSDGAEGRTVEPDAVPSHTRQSEEAEVLSAQTSPSRAPTSPSSEKPAIPVVERVSGERVDAPVRAARDLRREAKALGEGDQDQDVGGTGRAVGESALEQTEKLLDLFPSFAGETRDRGSRPPWA